MKRTFLLVLPLVVAALAVAAKLFLFDAVFGPEESRSEQTGTSARNGREPKAGDLREVDLGEGRKAAKMKLRWCPAGSFEMGSPESEEGRGGDETRHRVTLSRGFWMAETEVTQGQWKAAMDGETIVDLARKALSDDTVVFDGKTVREYYGWSEDADPAVLCFGEDDEAPVYFVSWDDTERFCRRLTRLERKRGTLPEGFEYRLPTEAEWEYACRAGSGTALPNDLEIRIKGLFDAPALDEIAWYGGNSFKGFRGKNGVDTGAEKQFPGEKAGPCPVGLKDANNWGLRDMIGNLYEWCSDWYAPYEGDGIDPTGPESGACRVDRGGGWTTIAHGCRAARRGWSVPGGRGINIGFRPVLAPVP